MHRCMPALDWQAREGELSAAVVEYRKALVLQPNQPAISLDLGLAEFKQGHFAEAIAPFNPLVRPLQRATRFLFCWGCLILACTNMATPFHISKRRSRADPANLEIHGVLAQSCLWSKRYDCALAELQRYC